MGGRGGEGGGEAASLLSYKQIIWFRLKRAVYIHNTQLFSVNFKKKQVTESVRLAAQIFSFYPTKYCTGATAGICVDITSAANLDGTYTGDFCSFYFINESYH